MALQTDAVKEDQLDVRPTGELTQQSMAEDALSWLRNTLGVVRPRDPRTRRLGPPQYRLDLLAQLCEREAFHLITGWLASDAVPTAKAKQDYADAIRYWSRVARELGGHDRFFIGCITRGMVKTWTAAQKARGASPRTINQRLSILSALIHWVSWETEQVVENPVRKLSKMKVDHQDEVTATPALEVAEFQRVVDAAASSREAFVVTLLYTMAARVTECCQAQISDLKWVEGRRVLDLRRKNSKLRGWPIPPKLSRLADKAIGGKQSGHLIVDADGDPMTRHSVSRMLAVLGREAGVLDGRTLTPHVIRATKLTHMYEEGIPVEEIQDYADHARIETTLRYIRRKNRQERREVHAKASVKVYDHLINRWLDEPEGQGD